MIRSEAEALVFDALDALNVSIYEDSHPLNDADYAVVARFAEPESDDDAEYLREYFSSLGEYKGFRLIFGGDGDCYLINTADSTIYYLSVNSDFDDETDELESAPL